MKYFAKILQNTIQYLVDNPDDVIGEDWGDELRERANNTLIKALRDISDSCIK